MHCSGAFSILSNTRVTGDDARVQVAGAPLPNLTLHRPSRQMSSGPLIFEPSRDGKVFSMGMFVIPNHWALSPSALCEFDGMPQE